MKNNPSVTLLISTYNWPKALALVLNSVNKQSKKPDQLLIADDGSTLATKKVIDAFLQNTQIQTLHVWHEDKGFRKSEILNKAIAKCTSDYLIQVDGDCILHPNFIQDHMNNADENQFLFGTRVRIKEDHVPLVLEKSQDYFHFFSKGIKKRPRSIRLPFLNALETKSLKISPKFRGCNCSFWVKDLIEINGYNQDFEGWGREDTELIIRLLKKGVYGKRIKFQAIVYHLDHADNSRENLTKNDEILSKMENGSTYYCENGLDKYLE